MTENYSIKRMSSHLFITFFALLFGGVQAYADSYAEDFSSSTGSSFALTGLPEGWDVIGTIGSFEREPDKYHNGKPGIAINANTENYLVTPTVKGNVLFYIRNYTKNYQCNVQVFACKEVNGALQIGDKLTEKTLAKQNTTPWETVSLKLDNATRLAILLSKGIIDDFIAEELVQGGGDDPTPDDPPVFVEKKSLLTTAFERSSDYEVTANEENRFTATFNVTVKNTGNVRLEAEDISVSIVNQTGTTVYGTATATDTLGIDSLMTIPVSIDTAAGEGGYMAFYAKENLTNTTYDRPANLHVTAYLPQFAINDPNGYKLWDDEEISFGTTNTSVSKTVTIKNAGTAPLTVSSVTVPEGFMLSESAFSVPAAGEKQLTITLTPNAPYGLKQGPVAITHALGTFSFSVSGTTVDPTLYFVNFEDNQLPASWTAGQGWSVTSQSGNHYAQQNNNTEATALMTQRLSVAEGQKMTFQAKRAFAYSEASLTVSYSADKQQWIVAKSIESLSTAFETFTIEGIAAGTYFLKFEGQFVAIDNIIGFTESSDAPKLAVYDANMAGVADNSSYDFGLQTADATTSYIIKNVGTGTLYADITATEGFSVDLSQTTLTAGQQATVNVTMTALPYGTKEGSLTILTTDEQLTISLKGETRDPQLVFVDFQDQQWPKGWSTDNRWTVSKETYSSTEYYAEQHDYNGVASDLITTKVTTEEAQPLTFDAKRASEIYETMLVVYYSADRNAWTKAADLTSQLSTDFTAQSVTLPAGTFFLKFHAANVDIDNITGIKVAANDHIVDLTTEMASKAVINWEYKATGTVTNRWADSEEVTLTFFYNNEEKNSETFTLAYGESQSLTTVFTPHALTDAPVEAYFEMTFANQTVKSPVQAITIEAESNEAQAIVLSGVITDDSEEAKPLSGVSITLTSTTENAIYQATTADDGTFSVKVWRGNLTYTLVAEKEGYEAEPETLFFVGDKDDYSLVMKDLNPEPVVDCIKTIIVNGKPAVVTNLQGQPVKTLRKGGFYIVNGRKIIKD